jgi:uncharacterized membrane protein (DUF106 family)
MDTSPSRWKEVAEAASKEHDPEKLIQLVTELNRMLEEQQECSEAASSPPDSTKS